jgi:sulfur-oxidizing protein SoxX
VKRQLFTTASLTLAVLTSSISAVHADAILPQNVVANEYGDVAQSLTGVPGDPQRGLEIMVDRGLGNCIACHQVTALEEYPWHGEVGPSLDGAGARWDEATLRGILVDAKAVFPETVMPAFYRTSGFVRRLHRRRRHGRGRHHADAPEIAENGNTVPIESTPPGAVAIMLLAAGNPTRRRHLQLRPAGRAPAASTRIRLAGTQDVIASPRWPTAASSRRARRESHHRRLRRLSFRRRREWQTTSNPASRSPARRPARRHHQDPDQPPDGIGQRKDSDGNPIPRSIINRFTCDFNGENVIDVTLEPAISTNPYFEFEATSRKPASSCSPGTTMTARSTKSRSRSRSADRRLKRQRREETE